MNLLISHNILPKKKKNSISAEEYTIPHLELEFDLEMNGQKEKKKQIKFKTGLLSGYILQHSHYKGTVVILSQSCLCDPPHGVFVTPWTVALQAPLSVEFSRQEYWSELPFPAPEAFPDPGIEPVSPVSPALVGGFFTTKPHEITLRCHIKGDNQ